MPPARGQRWSGWGRSALMQVNQELADDLKRLLGDEVFNKIYQTFENAFDESAEHIAPKWYVIIAQIDHIWRFSKHSEAEKDTNTQKLKQIEEFINNATKLKNSTLELNKMTMGDFRVYAENLKVNSVSMREKYNISDIDDLINIIDLSSRTMDIIKSRYRKKRTRHDHSAIMLYKGCLLTWHCLTQGFAPKDPGIRPNDDSGEVQFLASGPFGRFVIDVFQAFGYDPRKAQSASANVESQYIKSDYIKWMSRIDAKKNPNS